MSNKIYKINDYRIAKIIVRDLPPLITNLEKLRSTLNEHQHYSPVGKVCYEIDESLLTLKAKYNKCLEIIKTGGLCDKK